jgi:ribosome recycling factor
MSFGDRPSTRTWEQWEVEKIIDRAERAEELLKSSREVAEQRRKEIVELRQEVADNYTQGQKKGIALFRQHQRRIEEAWQKYEGEQTYVKFLHTELGLPYDA